MYTMVKKRRPMCEINVVPYLDVMLVLLVIFMITTPLISQGVRVSLPQTSAQPLPVEQQGPIIVSIDQRGRYYLNVAQQSDQPISIDALVNHVAAELIVARQVGQDRAVLVKGDQDVPYGRVVQVMALLQNAGVEKVGLMTENPEDRA